MSPTLVYGLMILLFMAAAGGVAYAFVGGTSGRTQKRMQAVKQQNPVAAARGGQDSNQQRRKNVQALLKDLEKQQAEKKEKLTLRRRIEQAGLTIEPRTYWLLSGLAAMGAFVIGFLTGQTLIVEILFGFAVGLGLPRWVLSFLKKRRLKRFTNEFANAIDIIVRSVKSGLPTNEALKIVAREIPEPVAGEFNQLCESLKVGVSMEQALKKMYERMPTSEVSFFAIVMTIQLKSGGNLSEALGNLSGVLRDRKRLQGKIKAMSSEAKASAAIIGSLPPAVMTLVYLSTPGYIATLFTEKLGNLMLAGCVVWMGVGIFVMKKMISFKH
ncbi:MAG: type II secretion system F family protein [Proteobacteria bacterium]|nr:type II secretion system F family protein [Pseudomonadota bacterium]